MPFNEDDIIAGYNPYPRDLGELIVQVHGWEGTVLRVEPHFHDYGPGNRSQFVAATIWIADPTTGQETDLSYHWNGRYWQIDGDGAGDPNCSGGSVLTGRDI